jgi:hypothetical protein
MGQPSKGAVRDRITLVTSLIFACRDNVLYGITVEYLSTPKFLVLNTSDKKKRHFRFDDVMTH